MRLKANPDGTLWLKCGGKTLESVRIKLGRPLYRPEDFATVFGPKGREAGMIVGLPRLQASARRVLEEHRVRQDLTSRIFKVNSLRHQFGAAYWDVETDKGPRQFVIRGTTEHVRWLDDDRMLITDVQGNRFEVPSLSGLDKRSQDLISLIL